MNIQARQVVFSAVVGAASLVLIGCPATTKKEVKQTPETPSVEGVRREAPGARTRTPSVTIGREWIPLPDLKDAYFDFDKADLKSDARSALKDNAAMLKKLPARVEVMVEGHCDERGTIEYNVALGQRRADAVKDYYAHAGVARSRLKTISYGKERPACTESTEDCWAKNRRGATQVKSNPPVTLK